MEKIDFDKTTIGTDYNKTHQHYKIDLLLDYLLGLQKELAQCKGDLLSEIKYQSEIEATKEILKIVSNQSWT